jgi:hypothetical protein
MPADAEGTEESPARSPGGGSCTDLPSCVLKLSCVLKVPSLSRMTEIPGTNVLDPIVPYGSPVIYDTNPSFPHADQFGSDCTNWAIRLELMRSASADGGIPWTACGKCSPS